MNEAMEIFGGDRESSHRKAVERVILSMHDCLGEDLSLEDMSRQAFISPFHFNRIFRRVVGIPPIHFLSALRIQAAKRMLAATEERIIDICFEVGFTSPGTFSRRFKELVGLCPLQFRRLAGLNGEAMQPTQLPTVSPRGRSEGELVGEIDAPPGFSGVIFAGLFQTALPHSRPASCCVLRGPGTFHLKDVPDGKYYLLALGFPDNVPPRQLLLGDGALRAGSTRQPILIRESRPVGDLHLTLRASEITDPPILITVPWLLFCAMGEMSAWLWVFAVVNFPCLSIFIEFG